MWTGIKTTEVLTLARSHHVRFAQIGRHELRSPGVIH